MMNSPRPSTRVALVRLLILTFSLAPAALAEAEQRVSQTITSVLREPLPPEDLRCSVQAGEIVIQGPTFRFTVDRTSGAIRGLEVQREGRVVASLQEPADIVLDAYHLGSSGNSGKTAITTQSKQKVVLDTTGVLRDPARRGPDVGYMLASTFYNDGVVVSELKLLPRKDMLIGEGIKYRVSAKGRFSHYLHKRRDRHGAGSPSGSLPEAGKSVRFATLTSCLEVFSPEAALAIFTDGGAVHLSQDGLDTAVLEVNEKKDGRASVSLSQYVVNIGSGGKPTLLKAGSEFTFRVGISIAPNRLPHPRRHDLRQYVWIGDQKHPYPTDKEILDAAQLGHTLFQMHRVGAPGEPRPPAGELERVIKKVHEAGMLFIWEANADLIYANLKRASQMREKGTWSLWQGFNYGGRYTAAMDPYCNLAATCLAAPNGLAEFRLACIRRMMDKYDVDGMYIDDNLAYANCPLWKEHGHPRKVYDCLIELHEMNWRRRQLLRKMCPHVVLIDHCSTAIVLPVICDFDVHLYGEGYGFSSLESYWDFFGSVKNMYAQGNMWAGDSENTRCAAEVAYNYDLLTGGGQYCYTDWRLYPKKFPYASGVRDFEPLFVKAYNLAQAYFGMYESRSYCFATSRDVFSTSAPLTYATVYHNRTWGDYLIPVANMGKDRQTTSLAIHAPGQIGLHPDREYVVYDVNERTSVTVKGDSLNREMRDLVIPGRSLKLLYVREVSVNTPYHLWGGKRISETWDAEGRKLVLRLQAPAGLKDSVLLAGAGRGIERVTVDGEPAGFFLDASRGIAHGTVTFAAQPVTIEAAFSRNPRSNLPPKAVSPNDLSSQYLRKKQR